MKSKISTRYQVTKHIGSGSFGSVFEAIDLKTQKTVAVKRGIKKGVLVSREYQMLKESQPHPNIIQLFDIFYTYKRDDSEILIQNLVFEFMPSSLGIYLRQKYKTEQLCIETISKIMKQLLSALDHLRCKNIMHRDIKPENILIDPDTAHIKICDFGSAKLLTDNENTPFIVSRYYRAPELIFGNNRYGFEIDIWAAGCVLLELFTGHPVFKGTNDGNQFIKQVEILGPPTMDEFFKLIENTNISVKFYPNIKNIIRSPMIESIFDKRSKGNEAKDLVLKMLNYDPKKRPSPTECLQHSFFN